MSFLALDSSHKVKQAALRLLRSSLAPETDSGRLQGAWANLPIREAAIKSLVQRLTEILAYRAKKLGITVRSELFLVSGKADKPPPPSPLLPLLDLRRLAASRRRSAGQFGCAVLLELLGAPVLILCSCAFEPP